MGAKKITVGDRSGMGDTRQVMEKLGVFKMAEALGFEAMVLNELAPEDWVMIQSPGGHWTRRFPVCPPLSRSAGTRADLLFEDPPLRRAFHPVAEELRGMVRNDIH